MGRSHVASVEKMSALEIYEFGICTMLDIPYAAIVPGSVRRSPQFQAGTRLIHIVYTMELKEQFVIEDPS